MLVNQHDLTAADAPQANRQDQASQLRQALGL
jgi:hypothetical protein